jgi:magnesium chelatase family protein
MSIKLKKVIIPSSLKEKISIIPNIEVYTCETLKDVVDFFVENKPLDFYQNEDLPFDNFYVKDKKYYFNQNYELDFNDVKGQSVAKRVALISACGFHNILLEGSPGCGKSMIAKRMQYILPPSSLEDILEQVNCACFIIVRWNMVICTLYYL